MLTYKQIVKRITDMLLTKFPTIEIQASDVEEGFQRPSFYVTLDNLNRVSYRYYSIRTMTIRIYFFPTDRHNYSLEVLDVQQKLEELFDQDLHIETRVIPILNTNHLLVDKVLEFDINIEYYEESLSNGSVESPKMQEVHTNV